MRFKEAILQWIRYHCTKGFHENPQCYAFAGTFYEQHQIQLTQKAIVEAPSFHPYNFGL